MLSTATCEESKEVVLMINPLFHIMAKGFTIGFGFNFGNTVILMPSPEVDADFEGHRTLQGRLDARCPGPLQDDAGE